MKPETRGEDDTPPPNRVYAAMHSGTIRRLHASGMSRGKLESIYGKETVALILGPPSKR